MARSEIVALTIVVLTVLPLVYYIVYVPRNLTFSLTPESLRIRGDALYARTIPRSELLPEHARIVNDVSGQTVDIQRRTNGVGLPNYQSGWFSTSIGKAFIFSHPEHPMVAIPTANGYTILLTPREPRLFLEALRTPGSSIQSVLAQ